jgi:hypothetical protein
MADTTHKKRLRSLVALTLPLVSLCACGGDDDIDHENDARGTAGRGAAGADASAGNDAADATSQDRFDPQRPPAETKQVEAWLARGFYKDWRCEDEPTAKADGAPAIHAHGGKSLVCTNALLVRTEREGDEEYPEGVASVKEILDADGKVTLTAVAVKIAEWSDGGEGWYWYEGARYSGVGISTCAGCHSAAGTDADHPGPGDFVYFRNAQ